jgi:hypothetical protein
MSNRPLEASNTPSSGSASKIKLNAHGLQGWLGRERVSGDIADIVVLRPADNNDRDPPASSLDRLGDVVGRAARLKSVAFEAIHEARKTFARPAYDRLLWSIVEVRIDRSGHAWLGMYESKGDRQILLVEFDDAWLPCSVWIKGRPDRSNLGDQGHRIS